MQIILSFSTLRQFCYEIAEFRTCNVNNCVELRKIWISVKMNDGGESLQGSGLKLFLVSILS